MNPQSAVKIMQALASCQAVEAANRDTHHTVIRQRYDERLVQEALAIMDAELRNPEPEMPDGGGYVFMGLGQKHVRILITKAEVSSALSPMALLRLVASKALYYMEETK